MVWCDMLCTNHRCRCVIAVELSRWQEGRGGEETVMDMSVRGRAVAAQHGMSCCVCIVVDVMSFPSVLLPSRAQEGERERRGGW